MKTKASIALLLLCCQGCAFLSGGDSNNDENNATNGATNGTTNGETQEDPSWESCGADSSLEVELTDSDRLEDAFSGLELGYVRAYYDPLLQATLLVFMMSESDDLEDAGDHTTMLFTATLLDFEASGTKELDPTGPINPVHTQFSQIKRRGTLGIDRPRYETRELTVSWETENQPFEVGERLTGEFDITLGVRCYKHDGALSYHGTFDTVLLPKSAADSAACNRDSIDGDWDDSLSVGELDLFADGRRVDFELHRVFYTDAGEFKIIAFGGEDEDESSFQTGVEDPQPGENTASLAFGAVYGCGVQASGLPIVLDDPESGSFAEGPNTGSIDTMMTVSEGDCGDEVQIEAEFTYGWCSD